jgi:hypothetical protein
MFSQCPVGTPGSVLPVKINWRGVISRLFLSPWGAPQKGGERAASGDNCPVLSGKPSRESGFAIFLIKKGEKNEYGSILGSEMEGTGICDGLGICFFS